MKKKKEKYQHNFEMLAQSQEQVADFPQDYDNDLMELNEMDREESYDEESPQEEYVEGEQELGMEMVQDPVPNDTVDANELAELSGSNMMEMGA